MTKTEYDVIIAGGGPSGSACAIFLGKAGYKVLLVDKAKFPRDKACGDGITGKSKSILEELNLVEKVETAQHAIFNGAAIYVDQQKLDVEFDGFYGYVSRRIVFDNVIFQEAKKFADVIEEFIVTGLLFENNAVVGIKGMNIRTKEEKEVRAKIVVGADGANSVVAREVGLNKFNPNHHASALRIYYKNIKGMVDKLEVYFLSSVQPGYFWIFPLENNMANVGLGMPTSAIKKKNINLQEVLFKEVKTNPALADRFKSAEIIEGSLRGWNLPIATAHRKMYGNGFVLLGDAASLIDPFTGEGIGNGLLSAKFASITIDEAFKKGDFSERVLRNYQKMVWKKIGKEIAWLQIADKFKWLLNRAIKKFSTDKDFKDLVTMSLADSQKRKKFSIWTGFKLLFKLVF